MLERRDCSHMQGIGCQKKLDAVGCLLNSHYSSLHPWWQISRHHSPAKEKSWLTGGSHGGLISLAETQTGMRWHSSQCIMRGGVYWQRSLGRWSSLFKTYLKQTHSYLLLPLVIIMCKWFLGLGNHFVTLSLPERIIQCARESRAESQS